MGVEILVMPWGWPCPASILPLSNFLKRASDHLSSLGRCESHSQGIWLSSACIPVLSVS